MSALTDRIAAEHWRTLEGCQCGLGPGSPAEWGEAWFNKHLIEVTEAAVLASVKPSREDVARVLQREFGSFLAHLPHDPNRFWGLAADAILAMLPGRSEAAVREQVETEVASIKGQEAIKIIAREGGQQP